MIAPAHSASPPAEQLLRVLALAAQLSTGAQLNVYGSEDFLRHLAAMPGELWGVLGIGSSPNSTPHVCWTVAATIGGMKVTSAVTRPATAAEIAAVEQWQTTESGARMGMLRAFPEVH